MASAPASSDAARRVLLPPVMPGGLEIPGGERLCLSGEIFGTGWRIDVVRAPAGALTDAQWLDALNRRCIAILETIDAQMSPWRETGELVRFNRTGNGARLALPEPMRTVVAHAIDMARLTGGAFDPTLHDAVALWGFGPEQVDDGLPDPARIAALGSARRDWRALAFDGQHITPRAGLTLDLCAIAKGFAVDAVMAAVQAMPGAEAALVEIGGELKGWGLRPDGMPWWVAVEGPDGTPAQPAVAALCGWAIATSGDYRRGFMHEGAHYSHAIDPATLAPVRTALASVTVLDPQCWRADALATAMMVMGLDAALAFARAQAIPCLLLRREAGGIAGYMSDALTEWLGDDG